MSEFRKAMFNSNGYRWCMIIRADEICRIEDMYGTSFYKWC